MLLACLLPAEADQLSVSALAERVEALLEGAWGQTRKKDRVTFRQGTWWMTFSVRRGPQEHAVGLQMAKGLGRELALSEERWLLKSAWPLDDHFNDVLIALEALQELPGLTVVLIRGSGADREFRLLG